MATKAPKINFTVEDLKQNGRLDAGQIERVLRQFQIAVETPVAQKFTPTTADLEGLAKQVAALVKPELQATGSSPLNTQNLLPGGTVTTAGGSGGGIGGGNLTSGNFVLGAGGATVKDSGFAIVPIAQGGTGAANGFVFTPWAPALQFGGAATGITYASQQGSYLLITTSAGSWAFLHGAFQLTSEGTATGNATVSLPVAPVNVANQTIPVNAYGNNMRGISGQIQAFISPGASLFQMEDMGSGAGAVLTQTNFTNTSILIFGTHFQVS